MTKTQDQPALPTERDMDSPYGICDRCQHTPAVLHPLRGEVLCATCAPLALLSDAAHDHLGALVLPVLAAWAHHWQAAGLPVKELSERLGLLVGDTQEDGTATLLASALVTHAVPEYTPAQADRVLLDVAALPTLDTVTYDGSTYRENRKPLLHFSARNPDGSATFPGPSHLMPGRDTVLLLNAEDGDAVLYYTGMYGQTEPTDPEGYRVPASMVPTVRKHLGYVLDEVELA